MSRIKISSTQKYPILPRHLQTSDEPRGLRNLIPIRLHRLVLWSLVRYWQFIGIWRDSTLVDFISFIKSNHGKSHLSDSELNAILKIKNWDKIIPRKLISIRRGRGGGISLCPTHTLISTYFIHNSNVDSPLRIKN